MFGRKGLHHLDLQGLLQWGVLLVAYLRPWQLLSSSAGCPGGGHLQPLSLMAVTSWTLPCDLQLAVTAAAEREPGEFSRKEDSFTLAV